MKVYVTKYALRRGILLMEVERKYIGSKIITVKGLAGLLFSYEYFETKSEATQDAEQRKENKLIQLQNQISKLENKNVTIIKEV